MIIDLCRNPTSTYFFDNFAWQDHFLYDTHVLIVRLSYDICYIQMQVVHFATICRNIFPITDVILWK